MIVLPSIEENCPMAALEGMAAGIPVVAARSGGTPDLIEDGVSGLMFDPTDPASARTAVMRVFNDLAFARQLAAAGRRRALEYHLPQRIAEKHIDIYREALQSVS
jgi:glycosyltransferase involved in cell wall biosynthesis